MAGQHRERKNIRLREFDYSWPGAYFITICTYQRQLLFGTIVNETMQLNDCGKIVEEEWKKTEQVRKEIILDTYCVMPNHFHGIVIITDNNEQKQNPVGTHGRASLQRKPRSIGSLVAGFKSVVTKRIHEINNTPHIPVWQSRFYDHIIRNDKELDNIRRYIYYNPSQWETDEEFKIEE